jgi:hypothetical protein
MGYGRNPPMRGIWHDALKHENNSDHDENLLTTSPMRNGGRVDTCVYACIHVCMYVYMCVCMYTCVYVCIHVCMYVCGTTPTMMRIYWLLRPWEMEVAWIPVCMHVYMCVCMYLHRIIPTMMRIYIYIYIYIYTHRYICTHTYLNTWMDTYIWSHLRQQDTKHRSRCLMCILG